MIRKDRKPTVRFCNVEHDSCIGRQIPVSVLARSPLACESRATKSFDVEIAMKSPCAVVAFEKRLHSTNLACLEAQEDACG